MFKKKNVPNLEPSDINIENWDEFRNAIIECKRNFIKRRAKWIYLAAIATGVSAYFYARAIDMTRNIGQTDAYLGVDGAMKAFADKYGYVILDRE